MSNIDKIFKPRRALKSVMLNSKASVVLSSGELFVECQGSTIGQGKAKIKIGDGSTPYSSLDYALGDTSTDPISFTTNTASTTSEALNSVASGNALQTIIGGLKQAVSLNANSIIKLTDDSNSAKSSISSINSSISSLNNRVSTNTDSINSIKSTLNSLTDKDDSNSNSLTNLAKRVTALESNSNNHYWEYIGYASPSNSVILQKDYSIIFKYDPYRTIGESPWDIESGSSCKKGYKYVCPTGKSYKLIGYVI